MIKTKKEEVVKLIEEKSEKIFELNKKLAGNPELGFKEHKAVTWITDILAASGFTVEKGIADLDTAFRAEYDFGQKGPVIGLLCEYDALPEIGHGCGHNMIAAASLGAALGLKELKGMSGKIVVLGCPGEEVGGGKVLMVKAGVFDDIDIAMMVHPSTENGVYSTSLAIDALEFVYKGKSAHASSVPEKGINALDSVIHLFNGINALRQYVKDGTRIHGVIAEGGNAPNVIPDKAVAHFYVRAPERQYLDQVVEKVKNIAQGAASMVGTELEWNNYEMSNDNLNPSKKLAEAFRANYETLGVGPIAPEKPGKGSTDMGNVSQVVPAVHPYIAIGSPEELTGHTREFAQATISEKGFQALINAAKALAFTAVDVLLDKDLLNDIVEEFEQKK